MVFDFLPAIERNLELRLMLRRLERTQDPQGPWESWLRNTIHATEQDLAEARQTKMTTVSSSGHSVKRIENICISSIPQSKGGVHSGKENSMDTRTYLVSQK